MQYIKVRSGRQLYTCMQVQGFVWEGGILLKMCACVISFIQQAVALQSAAYIVFCLIANVGQKLSSTCM